MDVFLFSKKKLYDSRDSLLLQPHTFLQWSLDNLRGYCQHCFYGFFIDFSRKCVSSFSEQTKTKEIVDNSFHERQVFESQDLSTKRFLIRRNQKSKSRMSDSKKQGFGKGVPLEGIPNIRYDVYFKIFGLISTGMDIQTRNGTVKQGKGSRGQRIYCQMICTMLWFFALRSFVLMFISDRELQVMMGDVTGYWNDYRLYYLMPMLFFSLQTAITSSIFLSKEKDLAWLVPFLSVKQLESGTMRTSQFRASAHKIRIYLGIGFDLVS